ncbi:MAG: hypothetical protein AWU55_616 [Halomonadaceae bacterium T82-2]|nr:MAG: hypothetical protein AWU55_616 [Halomonadaceae bacterium T82-2]
MTMNPSSTASSLHASAAREPRPAPTGRRLTVGLGDEETPTMTAAQRANARREAEYTARRKGVKAALLQLWKDTR